METDNIDDNGGRKTVKILNADEKQRQKNDIGIYRKVMNTLPMKIIAI